MNVSVQISNIQYVTQYTSYAFNIIYLYSFMGKNQNRGTDQRLYESPLIKISVVCMCGSINLCMSILKSCCLNY